MNEAPNKIIPNSFQTPNFFVDGCMVYLTGNEFKCLAYLARKTFGWQKRTDRISKSQIATYTGLNNETVDKCMETLVGFGLVVRVAENNIGNDGVEWALQTDDSQVRFDLMQARQAKLAQGHRQKTEKARLKKTERGVGLSNNPTPEEPSVEQKTEGGGIVQQLGGGDVQQPQGGIVGQSPQKPLKTKEKNMGANAPARASAPTPEQRIESFPEDCREGARLMLEIFNLLPPEKPAPTAKAGDYGFWINGIRALNQVATDYGVPLEQAMQLAYAHWNRSPFNLSNPGALKKVMASAVAQAVSQSSKSPSKVETPLADQLKTFKPRGSA